MKKGLYILLIAILSTILGYVSLIYSGLFFPLLWIKVFQLLAFGLLGLANVFLSKNWFSLETFKEKLIFSLQLFLTIFASLLVLYYFFDSIEINMALASSSAFILPSVISLSWNSYNQAFQSQRKVWFTSKLGQGAAVFLYGMSLRIKLPVKRTDRKKKRYSIKAPLSMTLGEFFNHFITMQNNKWRQNIEVYEHEEEPFGWVFYEEIAKGLWRRRLNPDLTFMDNGVKEHATIVAIRVAATETKREQIEINAGSALN